MRTFAVGLAVGIALVVAILVARSAGGRESTPPTLAERVAKNYRVLSKSESRTLVRYAQRVHSCVVAHGADVAAPVASSTRITMSAPNQTAMGLLRFLERCDPEVGPPPPKASLQARRGQVLVYLPKQCLLDPTEIDA